MHNTTVLSIMDFSNSEYNHIWSLLASCYCFTLMCWIMSKYINMEIRNNVRDFYRRLFSDFSSEGIVWYRAIAAKQTGK